MEYGFGLYEDKTLFPAKSYSSEIPVTQIYKDKTIDRGNVTVTTQDDYNAFVPKFIDVDSIDYKANIGNDIHSPLSVGDKVGTLDLYYNDYMIGSADLITQAAVESIPEETLHRQEQLESLKVITLKVLKIIIIIILSIMLILLLLRMFFALRRQLKRRRRGYKSYSSKYHKRQPRRKSKYKLKIK